MQGNHNIQAAPEYVVRWWAMLVEFKPDRLSYDFVFLICNGSRALFSASDHRPFARPGIERSETGKDGRGRRDHSGSLPRSKSEALTNERRSRGSTRYLTTTLQSSRWSTRYRPSFTNIVHIRKDLYGTRETDFTSRICTRSAWFSKPIIQSRNATEDRLHIEGDMHTNVALE